MDKVTMSGQLSFPLIEGQAPVTFPFKFEVEFTEKLVVDLTIPGPVVDHEVCQDTIASGKVGFIQVLESDIDATVKINNGTPLPVKGKRLPLPTQVPDPPGFFPGLIMYNNFVGGLTSIKFNSSLQMKVRVFVFE